MACNMIGKVFSNRYQVTERIGIGGMAEVYRAQDTVLGRTVALKIMLPQYAADSNFTDRFRQEAASAANLQSPYIVNIYDWGHDDDTYYIVMEYVRGSDLKTGIQERGALNQRKVAEIGSQVCRALSVAHKQDIIHRDIKPQNIMIQPDGNVKVMDFGIARAKNSVRSKTSSVLGTAHYISPEQAQGKELTAASDIYSLGVVLYEAATGKLPFDGADAVSVAMKQVNEHPVPPRKIQADIDPDLEAIILKALEKDPRNRFATANDMRTAFNNFLAGRPVGLGSADFTSAATTVMASASPDATSVMPVTAARATTTSAKAGQGTSSSGGSNKKLIGAAVAIIAIVAIAVAVAFATGMFSDSEDTETAEVPSVTGMAEEEAQQEIEDAGFELGAITYEYSSTVAEGLVISQDPEGDTEQKIGTEINLVVSLGSELVEVPDLTNLTADQARSLLESYGLAWRAGTAEYSSSISEGLIARQNPDAGETVEVGTEVTYYLSLGVEDLSIPNVIGYSESAARQAIENAGFIVNVQYSSSNTVSEGNVISQTPSSGTAERNTVVTIVVSTGPDATTTQTVSVPNVVGSLQSAAEEELEDAGFEVVVEYQTSSSVAEGYVISQTPSSGAYETGTTVTIVVSTGSSSSSGNTSSNSSSSDSTTSGSTDGSSSANSTTGTSSR